MIKVLIVEDDPMVAELNRCYLNSIQDFQLVGIINDGKAALEFLQKHCIDLILLDVFMPKLDGLELLHQIRTQYSQTDIIMVTASKSVENIQAALRLGVIDYVVKPFTLERFQMSLITYLERTRILNNLCEIDQNLIDKRIFTDKKLNNILLPKGIDANTLNLFQQVIKNFSGDFSVNDLALLTNLSRISVKKYCNYLEEIHDLTSYLFYPPTGRPTKMYRHGHLKKV